MSKVKERLRAKNSGQPAPAEAKKPEVAPAAEAKKVEKQAAAPATEVDDATSDLIDDTPEEKEAEKAEEAAPGDKKEEATTPEDKKKEKVNPWKIAKEHEAAKTALERENLELKKLIPNAEQRKAELAELENIKKRNQELEKQIEFVDYQSSDDFKTKYEKPYKDQWVSSMRDLRGVVVDTDNGERAIEASDMVELVNMTKVEASAKARELFGDYASDVMDERNKIKGAWDTQQKALEEAKTRGVTKSQESMKAHRETMEKLNGEVHQVYTKAVDSITKDPKVSKFIVPLDGDAKHNEILTKGLSMVDEAFRMNPMDPTLDQKARETIVKKHAAVRFRAAGYGVLKHHFNKLQAEHAELTKRLSQYESTVPNRGGSEAQAAPAASGGTAMSRSVARLRARAR